jgi:predicted nuclease of predicted toxin-antitoxin system
VKFKIDENLPTEFVDILAATGYEAVTVMAQRLQDKTDSTIIDVCVREGYILVTLDLDFADIRSYPPSRYLGLMVLRVARQDKRHLIKVFRQTIPMLKQESIEGRLWIIEETRIRIRGEEE